MTIIFLCKGSVFSSRQSGSRIKRQAQLESLGKITGSGTQIGHENAALEINGTIVNRRAFWGRQQAVEFMSQKEHADLVTGCVQNVV